MLKFFLHSRNAWNDYFTGTNSPNLNSQTFTLRETPSGTNVYIFNCLFINITSSSQGGALYCTSVTYFLVESTSFFSCKTSSNGGAIYFSNSGGQCVLHAVCGYDCCTTNSYSHQFGYTYVNSAASSKNYVNYSSITRCINENSGGYTMYM
jgi:predicted outer membrane repeat protein